ncbi:hypothetical protein TNCV_4139431 [Trichonephila clavipes]|nr:hypothetical protein TNCV_4139431 [Trichonephila clavipes]
MQAVNALVVSCDTKKQRKRIETLVHNEAENILLECCTATGTRNYEQKASCWTGSGTVWNGYVLEDSWHTTYSPVSYRYSCDSFN